MDTARSFLHANLGAEMVFILSTRLVAQQVDRDKSSTILHDVTAATFGGAFLQSMFSPRPLETLQATKNLFAALAETSIMHLSENSMKKLFELMVMGVKYQVVTLRHPLEMIEYTLNHLDAMQALLPASAHVYVDDVRNRFVAQHRRLSAGDYATIRQRLLCRLLSRRVKVSLFLEEGLQRKDGTFPTPPDRYLAPIPTAEAPLVIRTYDTAAGAAPPMATRQPHPHEALAPPPHIPRGTWTGLDSQKRMTTNGCNVYAAKKDILANHTRELPAARPPSTAEAPLTPLTPVAAPSSMTAAPSAEQLRALNGEMHYLANLAGPRAAAPTEKFKLHLFGDEDDEEEEAVRAPAGVSATATAAVGAAAGAATGAAASSRVEEEKEEEEVIQISRMSAGQVRDANRDLMGIIEGLNVTRSSGGGGSGAPAAAVGGGDDLLDIMDEI